MSKRGNQLDQLSRSIMNFQRLSEKHELETWYMKKLYESIKSQCLVIVYMAPKIRKLITEEELSGFILYLEERLKPILLSFNPQKMCFEPYLIRVASFRALNYLSKKIKTEKMDFALAKHTYLEDQAKAKDNDWTTVIDKQNSPESERIVKVLRYICQKRPSFQKRLFIYALSIMPFLESKTIERICKNFNINIRQTLILSNRIVDQTNMDTVTRREKYLEMRNRNWSHLLYTQLELEQVCESTKLKLLQKKEQYYIDKNNDVNLRIEMLRKKLNYQIIGKVLNVPTGTISSTIYLVKNVLKAIGTEELSVVSDRRGLVALIENADVVDSLPRFSPFKVFGVEEVEEFEEQIFGDLLEE